MENMRRVDWDYLQINTEQKNLPVSVPVKFPVTGYEKSEKNLDTGSGFFTLYNFLLGFEAVSNRFLVDSLSISKKALCNV